ncbi:MAG: heme o synthase [Phycisphaerae bacterium]
MSSAPTTVDPSAPEFALAARAPSRIALYLELAKARLSTLVLLTTAIGFWLAVAGPIDWARFAWTLLGTAACAFGVNALNQVIETDRDARMIRTARRPLPSGQLGRGEAIAFGLALTAAGPLLLLFLVNPLTAILGVACEFIYVQLYTPLKVRTPLNTLVGAVCGAIPPMMGWSGATGGLSLPAWILGGILFVWQIPHFLALAWLYREDYERGGFRMLPACDPTGRRTRQYVLVYTATLVPLTLMLWQTGVVGKTYAFGAIVLGVAFIAMAARLIHKMTAAHARQAFIASVVYLPLLLALMAIDRNRPLYFPSLALPPPGQTPFVVAPASGTLLSSSADAAGVDSFGGDSR